MIEMMCRDGGTPVELLDQAASVVEESIGCPVDLLDIDDHRAMVYWGPSDVASAIKELGIKEIDAEDMSLCADLLCDFEVNIHQATLRPYTTLYGAVWNFLSMNCESRTRNPSNYIL